MSEQTIWLYGVEGGYHDETCKCPHHCGNCFDHLTNPRARYCSAYCQGVAKRSRALGRALRAL